MDVTEDEAAIRTAVGALAGDDEVEQFLAWLRLGVRHASTPPAAKPATQAVAKEAVRRSCEEARKVRGPGIRRRWVRGSSYRCRPATRSSAAQGTPKL